jgi:hypothetical protein
MNNDATWAKSTISSYKTTTQTFQEKHMKRHTLVLAMAIGILTINTVHAQAQPVVKLVQVAGQAMTARDGYNHPNEDHLEALKNAGMDAAVPVGIVGYTTGVAAAHGAGSLAGYAGIASAVSKLGLGCVTTSIAGAMGSSATGAAATAVVTSAVGGPVVMGGILIGGTVLAGYGLFKGGQAVYKLTKTSF